jgi:hypothetical protein
MSEEQTMRLKCPDCGGSIQLWTDLHNAAQARCTNLSCDWNTFDAAVDL